MFQGGGDHLPGQLRFGGEVDVGGYSGLLESGGIVGPGPGQVEALVDQGMGLGSGVGEVDRDLAVLDSSGGARVLTGHPDGARPLLHIVGLVHDQDHALVPQARGEVATQGGCQGLFVQAGTVE